MGGRAHIHKREQLRRVLKLVARTATYCDEYCYIQPTKEQKRKERTMNCGTERKKRQTEGGQESKKRRRVRGNIVREQAIRRGSGSQENRYWGHKRIR